MDEATVRTRFSILTAVLISSAAICQDAGPGGSAGTAPSVRDLIEMRSIDSLVVSPNGRRLAFRLLSPSVRTDKVVARWYWISLDGASSQPVPLGLPCEPIRDPMSDTILDGQAQWSGTGKSLYVLALSGDRVAVHEITPGEHDRVVAGGAADVDAFDILPGGHRIRLTMRGTRAAISHTGWRSASA